MFDIAYESDIANAPDFTNESYVANKPNIANASNITNQSDITNTPDLTNESNITYKSNIADTSNGTNMFNVTDTSNVANITNAPNLVGYAWGSESWCNASNGFWCKRKPSNRSRKSYVHQSWSCSPYLHSRTSAEFD
jgi:hypothetical protein